MNPEAAREAHKILVEQTDLYSNVINTAGEYDAKLDSSANCSLAAHILNAVTIGVNTFVFNAIREDGYLLLHSPSTTRTSTFRRHTG